MQKMQVRDIKTGRIFDIPVSENTVQILTKDGVKVRLHPIAIRTMVRKGHKFDGQTLTGPREMELV